MDPIVKSSIEARKNSFTNAYNITNSNILNKIDDLFKRINELGENCSDSTDFEAKFAASPLNQEYINLFTEVASYSTPINYVSENTNDDNNYIEEEINSEIKYQMEDAMQPIKGRVAREAIDKARDIPVVGNAMDIKNKISLFNKFKNKDQ